jgi:Ca2+-binding EF-hand superfamily protein
VFRSQNMTKEAVERQAAEEEKALKAAQDIIMDEVPKAELEATMTKMFKASDTDGNGFLDRNEFLACVQQFDFGLTAKEIKSLMAVIDKNHDGKITYDEFVPFAVDILTEVIKEKLLNGSAKLSVLMDYFLQAFAEQDSEGSGRIDADTARNVLTAQGMSAVQCENLLMEANMSGDGRISYKKFARICAEVSINFTSGSAPSVLAQEKRKARAMGLFRRIDTDGTGSIDPEEMGRYMRTLQAKFRSHLTATQVSEQLSLLADAPVTEEAFVDFVCETFKEVDDEHYSAYLDFCDTASFSARVERLRKFFWKIDADGSGYVDASEQREYMQKLAWKLQVELTEEMLAQMMEGFSKMDRNGDGKVSEEEFITSYIEIFEDIDDDAFLAALGVYDAS